jgi:hypothetical protein
MAETLAALVGHMPRNKNKDKDPDKVEMESQLSQQLR